MNLWGIKDKKNGLWANVWVTKYAAEAEAYRALVSGPCPGIKVVRVTLKEVKGRKKQRKKA